MARSRFVTGISVQQIVLPLLIKLAFVFKLVELQLKVLFTGTCLSTQQPIVGAHIVLTNPARGTLSTCGGSQSPRSANLSTALMDRAHRAASSLSPPVSGGRGVLGTGISTPDGADRTT